MSSTRTTGPGGQNCFYSETGNYYSIHATRLYPVHFLVTWITLSNLLGSTSNEILHQRLSKPVNKVKRRPKDRLIAEQPSKLSDMAPCLHCHAKRFPYEPDGFCCCKGEIQLYDVSAPNDLLQLYGSHSLDSKDFRKHIRAYNNAFSFTSFGVTLDTRYTSEHTGVYTFRAQGQVYHFMNSLYPSNETPAYLQLYFYDTEREVANRTNNCSKHSTPCHRKAYWYITTQSLLGVFPKSTWDSKFRNTWDKTPCWS